MIECLVGACSSRCCEKGTRGCVIEHARPSLLTTSEKNEIWLRQQIDGRDQTITRLEDQIRKLGEENNVLRNQLHAEIKRLKGE
jgi:hypothetical protein